MHFAFVIWHEFAKRSLKNPFDNVRHHPNRTNLTLKNLSCHIDPMLALGCTYRPHHQEFSQPIFSPRIDAKFCHSQTLPSIQVSLHPTMVLPCTACRTYIPCPPPLNLTSTLFHPYATQYLKKLTLFILRSHGRVFLAQLAEAHSGLTVM